MCDDRRRTLRGYGPLLLLVLIVPATIVLAVEQWRLSDEVARLERRVRDSDAGQQSAVTYVNGRQQELAAEVESLHLHDRAYFPPHAFGNDDEPAASIVRRLRDLKAESLWELSDAKDEGPTARLLWLPADGRPSAVRLMSPNGSNSRSWIEAAQAVGRNPAGTGKVVKGRLGLLPEHAADLNRRIDKAGLWSAPGNVAGGKARWLLEGVKEGRYHLLAGGSEADPAFQEVARMMLDFAKMIQGRGLLLP